MARPLAGRHLQPLDGHRGVIRNPVSGPRRAFAAAAGALALGLMAPVHGAKLRVESGATVLPVVELYTSEGCSSCPPADEWLSRLGDTLGDQLHAVPLAFHVDYWNYLGWEDPFSSREYTQRQRLLGALNQQSSIYTPEFLVSGRETRGSGAVVETILSENGKTADVMIGLGVDHGEDDGIRVDINITGRTDNAVLYLAVYENDITRDIERGENRGRTLHHDFVVRYFRKVALLKTDDYTTQQRIEPEPDWQRENLGLAVLVMDRETHATRQAVRTPLESLFAGG